VKLGSVQRPIRGPYVHSPLRGRLIAAILRMAFVGAVMKRGEAISVVVLAWCLVGAVAVYAQTPRPLTPDQAKDHIGETAIVCGVVALAKYAASTERLGIDSFSVASLRFAKIFCEVKRHRRKDSDRRLHAA
jgi:hypothetical protein